MEIASEVRRCLVTGDVAGLMRLRAQSQASPINLDAHGALIALHMARVEVKFMPKALKQYSIAFLAERGIRKMAGRWIAGAPSQAEVMAAAGIASRSGDPRLSQRIVGAMGDAYLDALAAGIAEPPVQKERMLKARARERFRLRID